MDQKISKDKLTIQINMLESYIKTRKVEDFSILSFLFDLKELKSNLKVPYIYRRLQKEYKKEKNLQRVETFYQKSLKVFQAARKFIKTGEDNTLDELIDTINVTIVSNYNEGYNLFKMEFHV